MTKEQRNQWLIDNLKFVYTVCKKWRYMPDYEDILQVGCLATLQALLRVENGTDEKAIRGYVSEYINGTVIRYLDLNKHKLHVPYQKINEVCLCVDSIDYEYTDGEGKTKTYEEIHLADYDNGYDEAETMTDFERFTEKLKPKQRAVFVTMANVGNQTEAGQLLGYARGERVRQILKENRDKFDKYIRN